MKPFKSIQDINFTKALYSFCYKLFNSEKMNTNLKKAKENILNYSIKWNKHHIDFIIENLELAAKPETSDKPALNIGVVSKCSHDFTPYKVWMHECSKCGEKHYEKSNCY